MTARRYPLAWAAEERNACFLVPAEQNSAASWEWIGLLLLCALATVIIFLFGLF